MGYIDNTLVTIDGIVTERGRELLSTGRGNFKISKFAVADDEVDYRLWDSKNTNGSAYYGQAIEKMSLTESCPNQNKTMNFKMLSLPKNIEIVPTLYLAGGNYSPIIQCNSPNAPYASELTLSPRTRHPSETDLKSGYTATVSDADLLTIEPKFSWVFTQNSGGTSAGEFIMDQTTGKRTVKAVGVAFVIHPARSFPSYTTQQTTTIIITGNDTGGKLTVNVTIKPQPYISQPQGQTGQQTGTQTIGTSTGGGGGSTTGGGSGGGTGGGTGLTNPYSGIGPGGGCFAAGGKVVTKKRGIVNIEDLKIGEKVKTENGWSKIWGYQTYTHNTEMDFVVIKHAKDQIKLSTLHYIYVNNKPIFAKDVKVGDKVKYKGKYIKVSEVSSKRSKGIYSPMTINGRINVNDIDCSIYTDVPHILTSPLNKIARIIFFFFPKERYKYFNMKPVNKASKQLLQGMHKWMYIFGRLTGVTDKAKIQERLTLEELRNEKK